MSKTTIKWLLVGAPNSGKTSLFNHITGSYEEVMNYPGSTTNSQIARLKKAYKLNVDVVDTPGIYNLDGNSLEEREVKHTLAQYPTAPIIFVLDCRFLNHRLRLLNALLSRGFKCVAYCNYVSESAADLTNLHSEYGISFIDSQSPLALKALIYALENIDLQFPGQSLPKPSTKGAAPSYDLDKIFLYPTFSFIFTLILITLIFSSAFYIGQPISHQIETIMDFFLSRLDSAFFLKEHLLLKLLISGCILGIGTLLVYTPQIFLLFIVILFIQDSGYLARAAVILDPLLQKFGLHGKSFVPLLSGFSCAIPAILLSKAIESKRERLLTILAVPFMVCSARIPIYAMCISFLLYGKSPFLAGLAFAGCYFINLCLGIIASGIVNKLIPAAGSSYFMMELPPYKIPSMRIIIRSAANRVLAFIKNAGPIILGLSFLTWLATTFPNYDNPNTVDRLKQSYAGKVGRWIEPAFQPMGVDWKVGTAILTSFAAREVFVSSLTLLIGQDLSEISEEGLFESLRNTEKDDGTPLFSPASILSLLIFFMFALQCSSTVALTAKETKSWGIAIAQFAIMNTLAYSLAVAAYQILSRI